MSTVVLLDHVLCILQLGDDPAALAGEEQNITVWIGVLLRGHRVRLKVENVFGNCH